MFPTESTERLDKALEVGQSLTGAIDYLLNNDSEYMLLSCWQFSIAISQLRTTKHLCIGRRYCSEDDLGKFLNSDGDCYLGDLLMAAGFPYLELTSSNKSMTYECLLTYDVITKRLTVLDDLRKALCAKTTMGVTLLSLAYEHPDMLVFPDADSTINLQELMNLVTYEITDAIYKVSAREYMEKYFNVLSERSLFFTLKVC